MGRTYRLNTGKPGAFAPVTAQAVPSLSIADNSTTGGKPLESKGNSWRARSKAALAWNVQRMAEANPSGAAFLTLTVGDWKDGKFRGVDDIREISRRWNSLRRHLEKWLEIRAWVAVPERHASGAWHMHVFLSSRRDLRRGYDWGLSRSTGGRRSGANAILRGMWGTLRRKLPGFGFGRHQLEPVQSVKACGRYLGKYLGKGMEFGEGIHRGADLPERFTCPSGTRRNKGRTISAMGPLFLQQGETKEPDRRIRLVRYGGDWSGRMFARGWSWATTGGRVHRGAVAIVARAWGLTPAHNWSAYLRRFLGPKWCAVLWGWWIKAKGRKWGVVWALRRAENEGILPPGAMKKTDVIGQAALVWDIAGMERGRVPRGWQSFKTSCSSVEDDFKELAGLAAK